MNGSGLELDLDQPACRRLVDSAVYLLGALSPPERADYAAHLTTCRACQREVEALASVASLLSRTTRSSNSATTKRNHT